MTNGVAAAICRSNAAGEIVVAYVWAYNEANIIAHSVWHLMSQGVDVVVLTTVRLTKRRGGSPSDPAALKVIHLAAAKVIHPGGQCSRG